MFPVSWSDCVVMVPPGSICAMLPKLQGDTVRSCKTDVRPQDPNGHTVPPNCKHDRQSF
jgi:hypothetical protein